MSGNVSAAEPLYSVDGLSVGDVICYPPPAEPEAWGSHWSKRSVRTDERDLLRITAIDGSVIRGKRVHPQDWEREVVFSVYEVQIRSRGVRLIERAEPVEQA